MMKCIMKKPPRRTRNNASRKVRTIKNVLTLLVIPVTFVFVMTGCNSEFNLVDSETATLPPDSIQFESRDHDEDFQFETVLPTSLTMKLVPYAEETKEAELITSKDQQETTDLIYVTIRNEEGEAVYTNGIQAGGMLDAELVLPSDPQDFTVTLSGPKYEERTISLVRLNQYQEVSGTIYIPQRPASKFPVSTNDEDGDGVPDVYDAFPDNPLLAFSETIPAVKMLTIAFEDNYPILGDGDYNDFVATYFLEEAWAANGLVKVILGRVQALARVAGYNHRFGMMIDFENYLGVVLVRNMDEEGNITRTEWDFVENWADITLFEETKKSFSRPTSYVTLDNGYPEQLNSRGHCAQFAILLLWCGEGFPPTSGSGIKTEWNVYDPYLYVYDTGCDVHLIGKPPLPYSENPNDPDGFRDANGFPRSLLVPSDWGYPIELTHIESAYDDFYNWRTTDGTDYNNWYMNPNEEHVIHIEPKLPRIIITQELFDELRSILEEYFPGYIIF
jgi:LruC domain-containing protein